MFLSTPAYYDQNLKNSTPQSHYFKKFYILLLLLLCGHSSLTYAEDRNIFLPDALLELLQHGGYILYIRHGATNHSQQDIDLSDLSQCKFQRNLSQQGKNESRALGYAIKFFNIKIGRVYTSPYCRSIDTAKIAFERYEVDNDMRASFAVNLEESNYLINALRKQLSIAPKQGLNTVLIGHTANLRELTKVWPKPEGVTHVFKPLGAKGYQHLGHITPKDWVLLLGTK